MCWVKLTRSQHCAGSFPSTAPLSPPAVLGSRSYCHPHFEDEEHETQKGTVTRPDTQLVCDGTGI